MKYLIGYLISTIGGTIILYFLLDCCLWRKLDKPKDRWIIALLGILERLTYTTAILISFPQWIAVWLGAKVAVNWKKWQEGERNRYNIFLIGNLVSIIFGFLGALIILGIQGLFDQYVKKV